MRIIGGTYKGRKITPPGGLNARPTTDFGREGLFNTLQHLLDFDDLIVLDLFSGTGSISLEFISRGARSVTAVENNKVNARGIANMAKQIDTEMIDVIQADAFAFLQKPFTKFDCIFADPPYELVGVNSLPDLIMGKGWLADGGLFILEHGDRLSFNDHPKFVKGKKYGHVHFSIFEE